MGEDSPERHFGWWRWWWSVRFGWCSGAGTTAILCPKDFGLGIRIGGDHVGSELSAGCSAAYIPSTPPGDQRVTK